MNQVITIAAIKDFPGLANRIRDLAAWLLLTIFLFLTFTDTAKANESAFGVFQSHRLRETSFMEPLGMDRNQYYDWVNSHMAKLGARWTRFVTMFEWGRVESVIGQGYCWEPGKGTCSTDQTLKSIYSNENNIEVLAVITPFSSSDSRDPITNQNEWLSYVRAVGERYDGDGIGDADPDIKINYYQYVNELHNWFDNGLDVDAYVRTAQLTMEALREVNPEARLVLVSQATGQLFDSRLQNIIIQSAQAGLDFVAVDIHFWGKKDDWRFTSLNEVRSLLDSLGLEHVEIWSTENGTYVGCPEDEEELLPYQDEIDQARSLVKRYAWGRANGINKIFWNNLVDFYIFNGSETTHYNNMGLVGDDQLICDPTPLGSERLVYWAYELMRKYTDTDVATVEGELFSGNSSLYGFSYKNIQTGKPIYIFWSEGRKRRVALSRSSKNVKVINLIADERGNVNEFNLSTRRGRVRLSIGEDPIMVLVNH